MTSSYGAWVDERGLPAFDYRADHSVMPQATWDPVIAAPTDRHLHAVGNRRLQLVTGNDGLCSLWDEHDGLRWLTAPDPSGTGTSTLEFANGATWGSAFADRPVGTTPIRQLGPTWLRVTADDTKVRLERTVLCPEGEVPWVLVSVRVSALGEEPIALTHRETWAVRPRFANVGISESARRRIAIDRVTVTTDVRERGVGVVESFQPIADPPGRKPGVFGSPRTIILESLDEREVVASSRPSSDSHAILEISTEVVVQPGASEVLWFRFGIDDGIGPADPEELYAVSLAALSARLPSATNQAAPAIAREVPWHVALLTGGACRDAVLGGHTLDQGGAYSMSMGFNGAARDPLQHALPLVYSEPDLALSVLRNTCAWGSPEGDLPYALDGSKQPWSDLWEPSDQQLWALWLASEWAAVTGDVEAFARPAGFHPNHSVDAVPLAEHLRRQFRWFVDRIGLGPHGHVRICNADWNDMALDEARVDRAQMIATGESVLNSAMAAWVLPVWAALADRLGQGPEAHEARQLGEHLRRKVSEEWNGRWFRRAHGPDGPVGDDDCWLEVQPWAILCGATDDAQARATLTSVDEVMRRGSPTGARLRGPRPAGATTWGDSTSGGTWQSISMTLVWAATRVAPELAADELRCMLLAAHTAAYPEIWEGTLSGPDSWNAPESDRPGRTWASAELRSAMQAMPIANLHSHSQPVLAHLRYLGVEPTPSGTLRVGRGASFSSPTFAVDDAGHGHLESVGRVTVESAHGSVTGTGSVKW